MPFGNVSNVLDGVWRNDLRTFSEGHNDAIRTTLRRLADSIEGTTNRISNDLNTLNQQRFNEIAGLRRDLNLWNQQRFDENAQTRRDLMSLNQSRFNEIAGLRKDLNQWNQERGNDIAKNSADIVANKNSMMSLNQARFNEIAALTVTVNTLNQARFNEIAGLRKDLNQWNTERGNDIANLNNKVDLANQSTNIKINNLDSSLKAHETSNVASFLAVNQRIDNLALNGGGGVVELTSLITAITLAAKDNSDLWNAEHYDGGTVGEKDGRAVRLFKVQFQEIKTLISSMFSNYFNLTDANSTASKIKLSIENAPKRTESLLNSMYVTMNNRFNRIIELLEGILAKEGGASGSNGEVLARLDRIISSLDRCIEILTQILSKEIKVDIPDVTVNVPEVTLSESGNGWLRTLIETVGDVMKTAITSMADVLKTAIEELGKSLGKVLDFLDGLMDWVIKLVVPENLDFMESKFDSTSKTIKSKFPFIFDWVDIFKGMFGGQEAIPDIQMSMGSFFGEEKVNLPLSYFNEIAPNVRIFVTGFILLGFLIDMYKWFHTRGEVLE